MDASAARTAGASAAAALTLPCRGSRRPFRPACCPALGPSAALSAFPLVGSPPLRAAALEGVRDSRYPSWNRPRSPLLARACASGHWVSGVSSGAGNPSGPALAQRYRKIGMESAKSGKHYSDRLALARMVSDRGHASTQQPDVGAAPCNRHNPNRRHQHGHDSRLSINERITRKTEIHAD